MQKITYVDKAHRALQLEGWRIKKNRSDFATQGEAERNNNNNIRSWMNNDKRINNSLKDIGQTSAARTASLAADSMVTYLCSSNSAERTKVQGGAFSHHAPETGMEDDEFRLSTDIDALFFASTSSSSNDGGSEKHSLGDEEAAAAAAPLQSKPQETAARAAVNSGSAVNPKSTLMIVPQFVGPTATKARKTNRVDLSGHQNLLLSGFNIPTAALQTGRKRGRNASSSSLDQDSTTIVPEPVYSLPGLFTYQNLIPENEQESKLRRKDRNLREQMRSQRITSQISELKDLLLASNIPCKQDKFSTLSSVYKYIKDLSAKNLQLDEELRYLVQTINQTNTTNTMPDAYVNTTDTQTEHVIASTCSENHNNTLLSSNTDSLDYHSVFTHAHVPMAVIHLDGRVIDCNFAFTTLFGITRQDIGLIPSHGNLNISSEQENSSTSTTATTTTTTLTSTSSISTTLTRTSLFHLLSFHDMNPLFIAMSRMLENSARQFQTGGTSTVVTHDTGSDKSWDRTGDYWSGIVYPNEKMNSPLQINITLERNQNQYPKFFNCSLYRVK